jgi:hypothetical protein
MRFSIIHGLLLVKSDFTSFHDKDHGNLLGAMMPLRQWQAGTLNLCSAWMMHMLSKDQGSGSQQLVAVSQLPRRPSDQPLVKEDFGLREK